MNDAQPIEQDAYLNKFLNRTILMLGEDAVRSLRDKTVTVAGCGGMGGASAIMLARMGVGGFVLADPGVFDEPDINRQWGATRSTLGANKAATYEDLLRDINPTLRITTFTQGVTENTLDAVLEPADLVIDCLDISVPLSLRLRVYQETRRRGLFCVSSPIFGLATLMMIAEPNGMIFDDVIRDIIERAASTSTLPAGFRTHLFPEHIDAIERQIRKGIVASIAVAPALAAAFACAEILLVLLRDKFPTWRKPICLPEMLVIEALRPNYRIAHYTEVFPGVPNRDATQPAVRAPTPNEQLARQSALEAVYQNTVALPCDAVTIDLLSDVRSSAYVGGARSARVSEVQAGIASLCPYAYVHPVFRGRFAEALLAEAVVRPNMRVVTNGLFPTTRYHMSSRGARVVDIGVTSTTDGLDLSRLEIELARADVGLVYLELCNNAYGGVPISIEKLAIAHDLTKKRGILLLLDASRALTNVLQLSQGSSESLTARLHEYCRHSDGCAASLTKDFGCPTGGFVATSNAEVHKVVFGLAHVGYGSGLSPADLSRISEALANGPNWNALAARVKLTQALTATFREIGVPVVGEGSHAVFIDAATMLSHLSLEKRPADALAAGLFAVSGVRAARNLITDEQQAAGVALVRLAFPLRPFSIQELELITEGIRRVATSRQTIRGLALVGGIPGMIGEFAERYATT